MKLYIKQTVLSARPHFLVKDDVQNDKYNITTEGFVQVGLQLHIYDMDQRKVGRISQKAFSLLPTFRVFRNEEHVATIIKKFTLISQKYEVPELGWTVEGDFLAHDYTVSDQTGVIMTIKKEWLTWGDTFTVDYKNPAHELEAIALVLAIDCVVDAKEEDIIDSL